MSILPYLSPPTEYDPFFSGFLVNDRSEVPFFYSLRNPISTPLISYPIPRRSTPAANGGLSRIQNDDENFKVNLDVQQFRPNEVSVKLLNGYVVVDGKHEERSDEQGFVSRQFTRRYKLPDNVDADSITSTLSSDGVLSIGAPKKVLNSAADEKPIRIVQTNEPSSFKQRTKENDDDGGDNVETKK